MVIKAHERTKKQVDKQFFATVVVSVHAPDIFAAYKEAAVLLGNNLPPAETTWAIQKMSDRLDADDE